MASKAYENQKVTLKYSKSSIDSAARDIRHGCDGGVREAAVDKIQNFRELHAYPLMLMKNHLVRAANRVSNNIIVARRLKRLPTIINKLERRTLDGKSVNAIKLTRMQDIGGCRAIVSNLKELKALESQLLKSRSVHKIIHSSNYLEPKPSGYGGIHLIYSCFDDENGNHNWRKTKIEIQLRTQLQHAWATSLEIIDTLEQIELKTSMEGLEEWREFFSIAGRLVAHDELAHVLDSQEVTKLEERLFQLEKELKVTAKLMDFSLAIQVATKGLKQLSSPKNIGMCLVSLHSNGIKRNEKNPDKKSTLTVECNVDIFKSSETHQALDTLNKAEKDKNILMCVLLSAQNAKALKKAYPNYFGSTVLFRKFIKKHTEVYARG